MDGNNPVLLRAYGAYGSNFDIHWRAEDAYLMAQGWIVAIAHVRGGCEMGKLWYEEGKAIKKKNTFHDLIAVAEYLIKNKYTNPKLMTLVTASAGGLASGVCLNWRGDLFHSVICKVPFVDVLSAMTNPSLPLTKHEYDEWGNPAIPEVYDYIRSYDPYLNITAKEYPHMLVSASLMDIRVPYWGPLKYVAKLRKYKTDKNLLLIQIDDDGGHFGSGGQFGRLEELAFQYAFLFYTLELKRQPAESQKTLEE